MTSSDKGKTTVAVAVAVQWQITWGWQTTRTSFPKFIPHVLFSKLGIFFPLHAFLLLCQNVDIQLKFRSCGDVKNSCAINTDLGFCRAADNNSPQQHYYGGKPINKPMGVIFAITGPARFQQLQAFGWCITWIRDSKSWTLQHLIISTWL